MKVTLLIVDNFLALPTAKTNCWAQIRTDVDPRQFERAELIPNQLLIEIPNEHGGAVLKIRHDSNGNELKYVHPSYFNVNPNLLPLGTKTPAITTFISRLPADTPIILCWQ